jgi:F-type H+-transporting ATPase subunit epsilon
VLHVELVSPERILFEGEAEMVVCRTTEGVIAFLTGHAPFLGALDIAEVRVIAPGGSTVAAAVHGGFVEVRDDRVIILSDVAELPDQIDRERAEQAKEWAEEALLRDPDNLEVKGVLARAVLRLALAEVV